MTKSRDADTSLSWRQARVQDDFLANVIAGLTHNLFSTRMSPLRGFVFLVHHFSSIISPLTGLPPSPY